MNRRPLRPISDEDIEAYRRDGAVCLRKVFDQDWIDALLPIAQAMVIEKRDFGLLPHRPVNFMSRVITEFRDLAFDSPMGEACGRTLQSKEGPLSVRPGLRQGAAFHGQDRLAQRSCGMARHRQDDPVLLDAAHAPSSRPTAWK